MQTFAALESVDQAVLAERITTWLATLQERDRYPDQGGGYDVQRLTKYLRIVNTRNGKPSSVHAFVDPRTGDVFKAAGYKAPAKGVRFNLIDDESFASMLADCDSYGRYLYVR
jgi:hypothetical protein